MSDKVIYNTLGLRKERPGYRFTISSELIRKAPLSSDPFLPAFPPPRVFYCGQVKSAERVARSEKHAIRKHSRFLLNPLGRPPKFASQGGSSENGRKNRFSYEIEEEEWNTWGGRGGKREKGGKKLWGRKRKTLVTRYDIFIIIHNAEHFEHSRSVKSPQRKFLQEALLGRPLLFLPAKAEPTIGPVCSLFSLYCCSQESRKLSAKNNYYVLNPLLPTLLLFIQDIGYRPTSDRGS